MREDHTPLSVEDDALLSQYLEAVKLIRHLYLCVPTKSGRPSRGPRYIAVTVCTNEEGRQLGITSSKHPKGARWACSTCLGYANPIWADGPLPDEEDRREEWADWMAKGKRNVRTFQ